MELSPQLAARFETLQTRYPGKRSALIPMLMYAQDQYGYLGDDMIAGIALLNRWLNDEESEALTLGLNRILRPSKSSWPTRTGWR